ncbi:hypothetical protein [Paenibacillus sp. TSA_86.1]|uniref:hypothetical protein n=1 Tax=Paenibacillus sp. TSA_86.1 TaxID=3415649 RepID=UPI0040460DD7
MKYLRSGFTDTLVKNNFRILLNGKPIKRFAIDPYNELVREAKHWLLILSGKKSNKGNDVK